MSAPRQFGMSMVFFDFHSPTPCTMAEARSLDVHKLEQCARKRTSGILHATRFPVCDCLYLFVKTLVRVSCRPETPAKEETKHKPRQASPPPSQTRRQETQPIPIPGRSPPSREGASDDELYPKWALISAQMIRDCPIKRKRYHTKHVWKRADGHWWASAAE